MSQVKYADRPPVINLKGYLDRVVEADTRSQIKDYLRICYYLPPLIGVHTEAFLNQITFDSYNTLFNHLFKLWSFLEQRFKERRTKYLLVQPFIETHVLFRSYHDVKFAYARNRG